MRAPSVSSRKRAPSPAYTGAAAFCGANTSPTTSMRKAPGVTPIASRTPSAVDGSVPTSPATAAPNETSGAGRDDSRGGGGSVASVTMDFGEGGGEGGGSIDAGATGGASTDASGFTAIASIKAAPSAAAAHVSASN